jgi:hypothetical protein
VRDRVGSFLLRRPVHEILEGWHIERGYMWPYVLAAYFFSPLIVGSPFEPPPKVGAAADAFSVVRVGGSAAALTAKRRAGCGD